MPLEPIDHSSLVCGCTFRESLTGEAQSGYGSGPQLFAIAPNADPPHALVNVGGGNLQLHPTKTIKFPMYQCEVGEPFESEWKNSKVTVLAKLRVVGAEAEACWFGGSIETTAEQARAAIPVKGGCGC
jgi:hypothetical protein